MTLVTISSSQLNMRVDEANKFVFVHVKYLKKQKHVVTTLSGLVVALSPPLRHTLGDYSS